MNWTEVMLSASTVVWVWAAVDTRKIWIYGLTVLFTGVCKYLWEKF